VKPIKVIIELLLLCNNNNNNNNNKSIVQYLCAGKTAVEHNNKDSYNI
jgi:hypothetical protein